MKVPIVRPSKANKVEVAKKLLHADVVAPEYARWLEESKDHELQELKAVFRTVGRAPVDAPKHAPRLRPIKTLAMPESSEERRSQQGSKGSRKSVVTKSTSEDTVETIDVGSLQRTFSELYLEGVDNQGAAQPFDTMNVYHNCSFFSACSPSFLHDLVQAGGAAAGVGRSLMAGEVVYRKDDPGTSMFVIARGVAESSGKGNTEKNCWDEFQEVKEEIRIHGHFGEKQVLGILTKRSETISAKTALHIFEITAGVFTKLLRRTKADEEALHGMEPGSLQVFSIQRSLTGGSQSVYPEERRHFESETVRMYRELSGAHWKRRPTEVGRALSTTSEEIRRYNKKRETSISRLDSTLFSGIQMVEDKAAASPRHAVTLAALEAHEAAQMQARERLMSRLVESLRADMRGGCMMPADSIRRDKSQTLDRPTRANSANTSVASPTPSKQDPSIIGSVQSARKNAKNRGESTSPSTALKQSSMSPAQGAPSRLSTAATLSPGGSRMSQARASSSRASHTAGPLERPASNDFDESGANDATSPFEVECLPPLDNLSAAQKTILLKQLKVHIKAKKPCASSKLEPKLMSLMRTAEDDFSIDGDDTFSQIIASPIGSPPPEESISEVGAMSADTIDEWPF